MSATAVYHFKIGAYGKMKKKISEKIEPKLYMNNLGMIYYKVFIFCFDWKIKMVTVTGNGFKIEHMGK